MAIELRNVSQRFVTPDGRRLTALRDFDMTVRQGEFCAVVGPTGCGKSTTLNLITGLVRPSSGTVRIKGQPVAGIDPGVGFVFQDDAVFPWRNVLDNVAAGPLFRGEGKRRALERAATGSRAWAWPASSSTIRTSSRAACASASRWPRPSSTGRRSC